MDRLQATPHSSCLLIVIGEPYQGQLDPLTSLASARSASTALTALQLVEAAFFDEKSDWLLAALAAGLASLPATPHLVAYSAAVTLPLTLAPALAIPAASVGKVPSLAAGSGAIDPIQSSQASREITAPASALLGMDKTPSSAEGMTHAQDGMELLVRAEVVALVGGTAEQIRKDQPLMALGLDSSSSVQLTTRLEEQLSMQLPGTLAFDYPTIAELAFHLATLLPKERLPGLRTLADVPGSTLSGSSEVPAIMQPLQGMKDRGPLHLQGISMVDVVCGEVAALLGEPLKEIRQEQPLMAMGLASSSSVQLTARLEERLGVQLPGTLAFDYPTAAELAEYLTTLARPITASFPDCTASGVVHATAELMHQADQPTKAASGISSMKGVIFQELASLLGVPADSLDAEQPLMAMGLDSSSSVQLTARLEGRFESQMPGTLAFDYPTVSELADYLMESGLSGGMVAGDKLSHPAVETSLAVEPQG